MMVAASKGRYEENRIPEEQLLRLNQWAGPGAWLLSGIVTFVGLVVLFTPSLGGDNAVVRVGAGLIWIAIGLLIAGGARSGLIIDKSGIEVRGVLRGRRWNWSEIERFELKQPILRGALRVYFADGSNASALGFDGKSSKERALAEGWIRELNRRVVELNS